MNQHPKIETILSIFEQINQIPRKSKHEELIGEWLLKWGNDHGFETIQDKIKNVIIKVPGKGSLANKPAVVFQGHMDMVCEKTPDSDHDFFKDPIEHIVDGEWLKANNTTLGADNGIALAISMAVALDENIEHPPLELLYTVDEETGLTGAVNLEAGILEGKILVNIDSEDEGVFTIGCAGGKDTDTELEITKEDIPTEFSTYEIKVGGLKGGHSGVDINKQRGNAIHVLARIIQNIFVTIPEAKLTDFQGGTAHNAIPRDAVAGLAVPTKAHCSLQTLIDSYQPIIKDEFKISDPNSYVSCEAKNFDKMIVESQKVIDLIRAIPHGIAAMDLNMKGLVETSNNMAKANIIDNKIIILTSQRSSVMSRLDAITEKIEGVGRLAGAKVTSGNGYPAWEPNWDSKLVAKCNNVYKELFKKDPVIEVIHAGLECGIIGAKYPGMDMVSIGPNIENPHSPDERMKISDVGRIWDFIIELLKAL